LKGLYEISPTSHLTDTESDDAANSPSSSYLSSDSNQLLPHAQSTYGQVFYYTPVEENVNGTAEQSLQYAYERTEVNFKRSMFDIINAYALASMQLKA
jgi:hypothetical protein